MTRLVGGLVAALLAAASLHAQTTVYWDTNSTTAGAGGTSPAGTWASSGGAGNRRWSTSSAGTGSTALWTSGNDAVFSAGTDATGAYTVTVSGTQNVSSIRVDEGSPTLATGTINFSDATPSLNVATGSTLTFNTALTSTTGNLTVGDLGTGYTGTTVFSASTTLTGTLTLAGGTLRLNGSAYTFGSLAVTGDATLDLAGAVTLNVSAFSLSPGVTLTILNWAYATDFFYASNWSGATPDVMGEAPMNQVVFSGFTANETGWDGWDDRVRPNVPEPSTYGALATGLALAAFGLRRPFNSWRRRRS